MTSETIKRSRSDSFERIGTCVLLGFGILGAALIAFWKLQVFQTRWLAVMWLMVGALGMMLACIDYATKGEEEYKRIIFRLTISCLALVFSIGWIVR